ncbi:MAG: DUF1254 domain-containing protein [Thermomicrobiales bacterium]|nr:DUF1254 domain-containing protein [Thermomicrobiales bacterium]
MATSGVAISPDVMASISTPPRLETSLGELSFTDGIPSAETASAVYDYLDLMHGVEVFLNAYQGASTQALAEGLAASGVPMNAVAIYQELMDASSLFLTANADTIYFMSIVDLTQGPMVVETPPKSLGLFDDMWFRWIIDFGNSGPDRGQGGAFLLLPPGYDGDLPDAGYFVGRSGTTRVLLLGRQFIDAGDPAPAVARIKASTKIYPYVPGGFGTSIATVLEGRVPLAPVATPQTPQFFEATGAVINTIPASDFTYFEQINALVQAEPATAFDPELMGQMAAIGIVKGTDFAPDERMRRILTDAAAIGAASARTLAFRPRPAEGFEVYPDSGWMNPLWLGGYSFETPPPMVTAQGIEPLPPTGARTLNARTAFFYTATGVTPSMIMRLTGTGSQYLYGLYDADKNYFDGGRTYAVTLPPDIPEANFWSLTVYDTQTRSMLDTPQRYPRAGSQDFPSPAAVADAEGATTIWFAPAQPTGVARGNWIQTVPGKSWFVLLRLYSPTQAFFDKTWRPSEIALTE